MTDPAPHPAPKPRTPDKLVRAALELFQMRGYHAVGVTEILDRAGCPKGSLYHHFPGGKAALAAAAIRWLTREIVETFESSAAREVAADILVERLFDGTGDWLDRTGFGSGALLSVMAQEVVPQEPELAAAIGAAQRAATAAFSKALAAGGAPGAPAGPILAMLDGAVAQSRGQMSTAPLQDAKAAALRLVG